MNITVRYCGISKRVYWQSFVEASMRKLQHLAAIARARVTIESQQDVKRGFRVVTELEVPGPDFHAEAREHTLPAALLKVVKELERQIRSRKNRRANQWKTNLRLGLSPGRLACGWAGPRG